MVRQPWEIGDEINRLWTKPYFGAVPYIQALRACSDWKSNYIADTVKSVALYFLSNAQTWRGSDAKRIKAEIKQAITWPKEKPIRNVK